MKYLKLLLYYVYSFFFCIRYLPWKQAKKIPILIHPSVKIKSLHKGDIIINGRIWRGMISLGFDGTVGRSKQSSLLFVNHGCQLTFNGYACISKGFQIVIQYGELRFGANQYFNGDCFFSCYNNVFMGNNVMCGWNVSFMTTNGHLVIVDGIERERTAPIRVGNHVWIGSDCAIGKGVSIADNTIISHHSVVVKNLDIPHAIYGGHPAKLLKTKADWKA